jgi:hypothetical protein
MLQSLKACPVCGKQAGELIEEKASRFPFPRHMRRMRLDDRRGEAPRRSGEAVERSEARGQGKSASEMKMAQRLQKGAWSG